MKQGLKDMKAVECQSLLWRTCVGMTQFKLNVRMSDPSSCPRVVGFGHSVLIDDWSLEVERR